MPGRRTDGYLCAVSLLPPADLHFASDHCPRIVFSFCDFPSTHMRMLMVLLHLIWIPCGSLQSTYNPVYQPTVHCLNSHVHLFQLRQ